MKNARVRCTGEVRSVPVQPEQPAAERRNGARRHHAQNPVFRDELAALARAAVQQQLADAGLVARADRDAAAPVRAARHRLHAAHAGQIDPGIVVAGPGEAFAAAERAQHLLEKDLRQRPAEQVQQGQRELVDAHVVVFPVAAGRVQRARAALRSGRRARVVRHLAPAVDRVGQAEASAFPFARLRQQMGPGDGAVVRAVVEADAGQHRCDRGVFVGQQALHLRHAGKQREIALGDAEGEVGPIRLAPCRDLAPVLQDHARLRAARVHRAAQAIEGGRIVVMHAPGALARCGCRPRIARPRHFVALREGRRFLQRSTHRHGLRRATRPSRRTRSRPSPTSRSRPR